MFATLHALAPRIPTRVRAQAAFRCREGEAPDRDGFRKLMDEYRLQAFDLSYRPLEEEPVFE